MTGHYRQQFTVDIAIYKSYVGVFINTPAKQVQKWAAKCDVKLTRANCAIKDDAGRMIFANGIFILQFRRTDDCPDARFVGSVAHEVCHVVSALLESRGMRLNEHTDEAYAYLTEYLVREICGSLKQTPISSK